MFIELKAEILAMNKLTDLMMTGNLQKFLGFFFYVVGCFQ
jgi:hypothetical protein